MSDPKPCASFKTPDGRGCEAIGVVRECPPIRLCDEHYAEHLRDSRFCHEVIARLRRELESSEKLQKVGTAFHDLAVAERDAAQAEIVSLRRELEEERESTEYGKANWDALRERNRHAWELLDRARHHIWMELLAAGYEEDSDEDWGPEYASAAALLDDIDAARKAEGKGDG